MLKTRLAKAVAAVFLSGSLTTGAVASETIKMVWPYGPSANLNPYRTLIDNLNQNKKDSQVQLEIQPSVGGVLAVQSVANSSSSSVLIHTTGFLVHPKINDPLWNVNDWRLVSYTCETPLVIISSKYKSMKDLPKDRPISIGFVGNTFELTAKWFQRTHPTMQPVGYKLMAQSLTDVMGGHLDLAITLPGDALPQYEAQKLNILGVTGANALGKIPTFASQGYQGTENLTTAYFVLVNKKMPVATQEAVKKRLAEVNRTEVDRLSAAISCYPKVIKPEDLDAEYARMDRFWTQVVDTFKKK